MGHLVDGVVAVNRSLSRRTKIKTLQAGPQPYQPYGGGDCHLPYFQHIVVHAIRVLINF